MKTHKDFYNKYGCSAAPYCMVVIACFAYFGIIATFIAMGAIT